MAGELYSHRLGLNVVDRGKCMWALPVPDANLVALWISMTPCHILLGLICSEGDSEGRLVLLGGLGSSGSPETTEGVIK